MDRKRERGEEEGERERESMERLKRYLRERERVKRERYIQERVNGEIIGELFHVNCFMRKRELMNERAVGLKEKLFPNMILRNEYEFKSLNETQTKDCHMAFLKPSSTKPSGGGVQRSTGVPKSKPSVVNLNPFQLYVASKGNMRLMVRVFLHFEGGNLKGSQLIF